MINWFLQRNFLGRMIFIAMRLWVVVIVSKLYHQSDYERNEMFERKTERKRVKENRKIGKQKIDNIVEDFPILLLYSLLIHFIPLGVLWHYRDRICAFSSVYELAYVCMCLYIISNSIQHTDERNSNEKGKASTTNTHAHTQHSYTINTFIYSWTNKYP